MATAFFVTMTARPGGGEALRAAALDIVGDVAAEPGCLAAWVLADPADPLRTHVFEVYRDEAAIEAHKASAHVRDKGPPLRALYAVPAEVRAFDATAL
jgi:quinol monooxygenase YgiN